MISRDVDRSNGHRGVGDDQILATSEEVLIACTT